MHELIERKRTAIAEVCCRYNVRRLEVFGSAARGDDFDPQHSDADFLVEFVPDAMATRPLQTFFGLQAALAELLERSVDLVELSAIHNQYILSAIERTREVAYPA